MRVDVTVLQVSCCFGPLLAELPCLSPLPSDIQKTWPQVSEELLCLPRFGKQQVRVWQDDAGNLQPCQNGKYTKSSNLYWHLLAEYLAMLSTDYLEPPYTIGQAGAEGLRTATANTGASRMKCRRSLPSASWTPVISSQQHSSIADLSGWAFTWAQVSLVACPSHSSQIHLLVLSACLQMQYQQDLNRSIWTPSCSSSRTLRLDIIPHQYTCQPPFK